MRRPISAVLVAAVICLSGAHGAVPNPRAFRVGIVTRQFVPPEPYDWRGDAQHALAVTIWYPAGPGAQEQAQMLGPPGRPLLDGGQAAPDAALSPTPVKFPLIVLSHGTGGTAGNLAWLGTALASRGFVAAAVNHPGNNAVDGYTVQGFALWWERAHDLSAVIDGMLVDAVFGSRIDRERIGAAGHSLGGYTVIAIAGGITSFAHFKNFCNSPDADAMCKAPPEFADLRAKVAALTDSNPGFRAVLKDHGRSVRDPRVRAVFAMAPALGPVFTPESLENIEIPVAIIAGAGDEIVPIASSARYLAAHIPHAELTILPAPVGHYVFTGICLPAGRAALPRVCNDAPGVDRAAILAKTADLAKAFFARQLP